MIFAAALVGLALGALGGWLWARRRVSEQLAAIEAEWSKKWRFEEARMMGRITLAHEERDSIAAERDAAWWKWLEALASGKIPLAEAMRNAPAPRPGRGHSGSRRNDSDLRIHVDDTDHASQSSRV